LVLEFAASARGADEAMRLPGDVRVRWGTFLRTEWGALAEEERVAIRQLLRECGEVAANESEAEDVRQALAFLDEGRSDLERTAGSTGPKVVLDHDDADA
jgi:hypothetical protein